MDDYDELHDFGFYPLSGSSNRKRKLLLVYFTLNTIFDFLYDDDYSSYKKPRVDWSLEELVTTLTPIFQLSLMK
jgi:hypothetical protein